MRCDREAADVAAITYRCAHALPPGPYTPQRHQNHCLIVLGCVVQRKSGAMDQLYPPVVPLEACSKHSIDDSVDKYPTHPNDPRLNWQLSLCCTRYIYALYACV